MIETAISPAKIEEIMFCVGAGAQKIAVLAPWQICATLSKEVYQATLDVSYRKGIIPVTLGLDVMNSPSLEDAITKQAHGQLARREWKGLMPAVFDPELSLTQLQELLSRASNGWLRLSVQINLAEGNTSGGDYRDRVAGLVTALRAWQQPPAERIQPILNELYFLTPQNYMGLSSIFVGELSKGGYRVIEI